MKTIITTTILATSLVSAANAEDFYFKPYVGADYEYVHLNYNNDDKGLAKENLNGGNAHVGARIHKNLGFEGGYTETATATKDNVLGSGLDSSIKLSGFNLDALAYLPVGDGKLELIATGGVAYTKIKIGVTTAGSASDWQTKGRFGAGGQYWLSDNANIRAIARYQDAGDGESAIIGNLGINYQF